MAEDGDDLTELHDFQLHFKIKKMQSNVHSISRTKSFTFPRWLCWAKRMTIFVNMEPEYSDIVDLEEPASLKNFRVNMTDGAVWLWGRKWRRRPLTIRSKKSTHELISKTNCGTVLELAAKLMKPTAITLRLTSSITICGWCNFVEGRYAWKRGWNKVFDVQHVIEDGTLVAVNLKCKWMTNLHCGCGSYFENGKIAELWDIGQMQPEWMKMACSNKKARNNSGFFRWIKTSTVPKLKHLVAHHP